MHNRTVCILAAGGALCGISGSVMAADVIVGSVNADIAINAKDVSSFVFDGNTPPNFTDQVLADIHSDINMDLGTDSKITIAALQTDAGLGLFVLVDREFQNAVGGTDDSALSFKATGSEDNMSWINDAGGDLQTMINPPDPTTVLGVFKWDSSDRGDAFAWANLKQGDEGTFTFTTNPPQNPDNNPDGLDSSSLDLGDDAIQIVSWNEETQEWVIAGFNSLPEGNDEFTIGMDWAVLIPLPGPAAMGIAGLAGLGLIRRRQDA